MTPIPFPESNVIIAENQPEYMWLPALVTGDAQGTVVFCWQLTPAEITQVCMTGQIWQTVLTFHQNLQPQLLTVEKPIKVQG